MSHRESSFASIRWFGDIPSGWAIERLKQVTVSVTSGVSVNATDSPAEEHQQGVLKTSSVAGGRFLPTENKAVWESELERLACPVTGDSVIMSRMNTPSLVGESGYVPESIPHLFLPDRLWKLTFNKTKVFTQFIATVLSSSGARQALSCMATGTSPSMKNLSIEEMGNLPIPLPPIEIQKSIANYLKGETARIDGLIAEKERMLALLEEKRAALISRVVTRGLDPNAPLKPSGQEWLGDIPAHWRLERLKFHLFGVEQGWSPQCDNYLAEPDEWGVLKVGAVNSWTFNPSENKRLPDDVEPFPEYEIKQRDVLMSRANTTQLLGSAVYVDEVSSKLLLCDKLYRLDVNDNQLDREFLVAYLRAQPGRFQLEREASGTSGSMQNIGQDTVQNAWITIPPLNEQKSIARRIRESRQDAEKMDSALRTSIGLLRERRAALITAAVTGQIPLEEMTG